MRPKVLSSKTLSRSWRLELVEDEIKFKDRPSFRYVRVRLPPSTIVLATRQDGKVPLVKQYRHGAQGFFWELPAGYLEEGENPEDCIRREFQEEVGYKLVRLKKLGSFYLQPSRSSQIVHIFKGKVGKYSRVKGDDTESIECKFFSLHDVWRLLSRGEKSSMMHVLTFLLSQKNN